MHCRKTLPKGERGINPAWVVPVWRVADVFDGQSPCCCCQGSVAVRVSTSAESVGSEGITHPVLAGLLEGTDPLARVRPALLTPEVLLRKQTHCMHSVTHSQRCRHPFIFFRNELLG